IDRGSPHWRDLKLGHVAHSIRTTDTVPRWARWPGCPFAQPKLMFDVLVAQQSTLPERPDRELCRDGNAYVGMQTMSDPPRSNIGDLLYARDVSGHVADLIHCLRLDAIEHPKHDVARRLPYRIAMA